MSKNYRVAMNCGDFNALMLRAARLTYSDDVSHPFNKVFIDIRPNYDTMLSVIHVVESDAN